MIKTIILLILITEISIGSAQTFTKEENVLVKNKKTFSYSYNGKGNVTNLLSFFMEYRNKTTISDELIHDGVTYDLFKDTITPSSGLIVVGLIKDFEGKKQSGLWQFKLNTDSEIFISKWGIIENIPEAKSYYLFLVGGLILLIIKKYA